MRIWDIFRKNSRDAPRQQFFESDELMMPTAVRSRPHDNPFTEPSVSFYEMPDPAMSIPAVNSAVDTISNTIASIPVKLYKYKAGNIVEVKNDPRVTFLNQDCGGFLNGYQLKRAMVRDYLLKGNGYAYIIRRNEDFDGLAYVPSSNIQKEVVYTKGGGRKPRIRIGTNVYQSYEFIRLLRNTIDGIKGTSIYYELGTFLKNARKNIEAQFDLLNSVGNGKYTMKHSMGANKKDVEIARQRFLDMLVDPNVGASAAVNEVEFNKVEDVNTNIPVSELNKILEESINNIFHIKSDFNSTFREAIYPIIKAFEAALNEDLLLERQKNKMFFSLIPKQADKFTQKCVREK